MKRIILFSYLFFISFFCFAQQNLPAKIIGNIPVAGSGKKYQIQVGAFKNDKNTQDAVLRLRNIDLKPVAEKFCDLTRVLVKEIPANQVRSILSSVAKAGFKEVIIREDTPSISLSLPKKQDTGSGLPELISKTWKVESCPNPELIGARLFIKNDGTYYVKNSEGETSSLSNWRFNGNNEFEYTHNNWKYYGKVEIIKLTDDSFELLDPGYNYDTPGRSSAGYSNQWVFSRTID